MTRYAERTKVPVAKSRADIEAVLRRYDAEAFGFAWEGSRAMVTFRIAGRYIRMSMDVPEGDGLGLGGQETRQRWRALLLVIKAKLEAVDSGISTIEDEFMAHIVLPDGQTVGDFMKPQIAIAYDRGDMPPLLTWAGSDQ